MNKSFSNKTFEVIRERRAVRRFRTKEVPQDLILELLDLANTAPSNFNLQPWYFVLVQNPELKSLLKHVALDQTQVEQAPAVVVFAADPEAWKRSYPPLLAQGEKTGQMHPKQIASYRRTVPLLFRTGPLGFYGLAKRLAFPFLRLFRPTPNVITSRDEAVAYVKSQTMLAAATFMIAAKSAGVDTSPMGGFDEGRLKKLLGIPRSMCVAVIIALGYEERLSESGEIVEGAVRGESLRYSLEEKLRIDLFANRFKLK